MNDNLETPDTMLAKFYYPGFLGCYESRTCNPMPMFDQGYGTSFHGTEGDAGREPRRLLALPGQRRQAGG